MKKSLIVCLALMLVLSISFVSAGFFGDLFGKITGKYLGGPCLSDGTCAGGYCCDDGTCVDCGGVTIGDSDTVDIAAGDGTPTVTETIREKIETVEVGDTKYDVSMTREGKVNIINKDTYEAEVFSVKEGDTVISSKTGIAVTAQKKSTTLMGKEKMTATFEKIAGPERSIMEKCYEDGLLELMRRCSGLPGDWYKVTAYDCLDGGGSLDVSDEGVYSCQGGTHDGELIEGS